MSPFTKSQISCHFCILLCRSSKLFVESALSSSYGWTRDGWFRFRFRFCLQVFGMFLLILGQFAFACLTLVLRVFMYFLMAVNLVVSTSAVYCLEWLISEMSCYVSSGMLNSLTHLALSLLRSWLHWHHRLLIASIKLWLHVK